MRFERIGRYDVTALIGEGGMGQVWQATDTQLNRQVALKILPDAFADDPDRLARFQREAQVLASLNHPNIGGIHGIEEAGGTRALVLELVEGPTLADRIAQGPIPVDDALPIAKQIAEALEAAHEAGVIHRDLKPANIKVREDGTVKVLDFGLAKAFQPEAADANVSASPTISLTAAATQIGMVIGTAAYMAPEQAKGSLVDTRSDVWSFGVVLFEMLSGRRPFVGDDVSTTLARVIEREPDWDGLPNDLSQMHAGFLQGCLRKDPKDRVQDITNVRLALDGMFDPPTAAPRVEPTDSVTARASRGRVIAIAVVAAVAGGLLGWGLRASPDRARSPLRLSVAAPEGKSFSHVQFALSPDGSKLAFIGLNESPQSNQARDLWIEDLATSEARMVPATNGASFPFWAPDSRSISFFADDALRTVAIGGGTPVVLSHADDVDGAGTLGRLGSGAWNEEGVILFAVGGSKGGIFRVSETGKEVARVTAVGGAAGEIAHANPYFLPDGRDFLYVARHAAANDSTVFVGSLDSRDRTPVLKSDYNVAWMKTGHLIYLQNGALMAQTFDPGQLELLGPAVALGERVRHNALFGFAAFSIPAAGHLAHRTGGTILGPSRALALLDRRGQEVARVSAVLEGLDGPRVSPNGQKVVVRTGEPGASEVWIHDLNGRPALPLVAYGSDPLWSHDGERVLFVSSSSSQRAGGLMSIPANGSVLSPEPLAGALAVTEPLSASPDGRELLVAVRGAETGDDIWVVALDGSSASQPWLETQYDEGSARFSPNGQWVAYVSDRLGHPSVWVRPYPGPGRPIPVSEDVSRNPVWSRDGRELFFVTLDGLFGSSVRPGSEFDYDEPVLLFGRRRERFARGYDVTADGSFVMIQQVGFPQRARRDRDIQVVVNWIDEVKRLVPTP